MPVDFRCPQCHGLLRTPDESIGKPAKCPVCGNVVTVPELTAEGSPLRSDDPFQAAYPYYQPANATARVSIPAIWLIVAASLNLVFLTLNLLQQIVRMTQGWPPMPGPLAGMPVTAIIGSSTVGLVLNIVVLLGAIRMKQCRNYGLAMGGAIAALVPCFSPCCVLSFPFGIWALVVLMDDGVRNAFR